MDFGNQGARTERPYPPSSMKDNSCLSSSSMSRSSFAMSKSLRFSLCLLSNKPLLMSYEPRADGTATDMPIEIQSISRADHICFQELMRKVPQGLSENSQSVPFSTGESRKRLINQSARLLLKVSCFVWSAAA